jgi:hypothetical protein
VENFLNSQASITFFCQDLQIGKNTRWADRVASVSPRDSESRDVLMYGEKKLPRANYADRATTAYWRSSANFCGYRVLRGQRNGSPRSLVPVFLTGAATISSKWLLSCPNEAEWTPFQTHCFSENLEAPGIELRTSGSVGRNSDH